MYSIYISFIFFYKKKCQVQTTSEAKKHFQDKNGRIWSRSNLEFNLDMNERYITQVQQQCQTAQICNVIINYWKVKIFD